MKRRPRDPVTPARRILCPTDLSASADRTLEQALDWRRWAGAELEVLHVIRDSGADREPPMGVIDAGLALERLLARHQADLEATRVVTRGHSAARAIVDHAEQNEIDLIVMGTHGERGFRSLLVGSVIEEVVRTARCPVLAVPPQSIRSSIGPPRWLLVPLDFGPHAAGALRLAKELAAPGSGTLVLLHVIEEAVVPDFHYPLGRSLFLREPEARSRSFAALDRLYWEVGGPDLPFEVRVVSGRAGIDIPRIAAKIAADVIVLPTHGIARPEGLALGSTTEKVLRGAPCPILVQCAGVADATVTGPTPRSLMASPVG